MNNASITLNHTVKQTKGGTVSLLLNAVGYNIDSKVFAIEVLPRSADAVAPYYRFSHVCSPQELIEFPADEPRDNCYFRVAEIELIFDTKDMVEHVMSNMKMDIRKLVRDFNELDSKDNVVKQGSDTF